MLSQSLIWRKKHGVDKILSEYELPTVAKEYFPGKMHVHFNLSAHNNNNNSNRGLQNF